ncbi:hypothetical protein HYDPIDRAFT_26129 [Hydnomerulius pinastri MD-312]|nr:hypothetical protein HYDPIDRAFT_26129 [Hydnomerulius pinastri MD-312]
MLLSLTPDKVPKVESEAATRPRRICRPTFKVLENSTSGIRGSALKRVQRADLEDDDDSCGDMDDNPEIKFKSTKRPRQTLRMEVVVPTLQVVDGRRKAPTALARPAHEPPASNPRELYVAPTVKVEEDAKTYFLLNAKIKVEVKQEEVMSEEFVRGRLAIIGYESLDIKLAPDILGATTTREFTSRIWGGNTQALFPTIGKEFTHGLDDFMYTNLLFNPHAPRWPGAPGLLFRFRDDGPDWPDKIQRVIVRLRTNSWQYMGQYKMLRAPPLTPEEWNAQAPKTKQIWATRLVDKKGDGGVKAKIILRKRLQREPSAQEIKNAVRSGEVFKVTADEILQACDEGRAVSNLSAWPV